MNTASEIVAIPLNKLVPSSKYNVRKTGGLSIDDLAASIQAHGLLHNLVVTQTKGGKHEVVAGGRRLAALNKLAKEKSIPKTFDVPCRVIDGEGSTESSLAENILRQAMHPADQFEAFRSLVDQGHGIEEIASRFGATPSLVRQRLKLANIAPRLLELYRAEKITLDQLMALAITDDHAAQERVWEAAAEDWQRQPHNLRRALTASKVDAATDPRARFVGIQAYLADGGLLDRDLFQPEHEGYLTDPAKLDRLVADKLEAIAAEVRGEGWKWVEIQPVAEYPDLAKFGRIHSVYVPLTEEIRSAIQALQTEQEEIESAHADAEEYPPDVDQRMAEIESRIDELNNRPRKYHETEMAFAGAIISVGNQGEAVIHRGLVRPEDKKKVVEVSKSAANSDGNTQEPKGNDEEAKTNLSAALIEDLTAHRTVALRAALASRPDVALVAVTHALALRLCYPMEMVYGVGSALSLSSEKGVRNLESYAGIETSLAHERLDEIQIQWLKQIPEDPAEFWQWLMEQEEAVVKKLLAYCVGKTVHVIRRPFHKGDEPEFVAADQIAKAISFDMSDWWTPTGESYLGRVKRDQILEAIGEGTTETNFEDLRKMKKAELVTAAERRLAGSRWLPEILRA
jgi:ParB family transcriptional regulator, chromosome partitioning protein